MTDSLNTSSSTHNIITLEERAERGALILRALRGTDITVLYQNADLKYLWAENVPTGWNVTELIGNDDYTLVPPESAAILTATKKQAIRERRTTNVTVEFETETGSRCFEIWIDPDFHEDGTAKGCLCFSVEKTLEVQQEKNLKNLLLEVSHRSRNLLAIVQSVGNQTARANEDVETFMARYNARIGSLARTLDIVTHQEWEGATIHDLARAQVQLFRNLDEITVIEGLNPFLMPSASLHVGLGLQELAANAAAYQNIKNAKMPTIAITISRLPNRNLEIIWSEKRDSDAVHVNTDGFASQTLLKIVPLSVGGSAELSFEDETLRYRLTIPKEHYH